MKKLTLIAAALLATPAAAATGPFLSLGNSNFIVLLAFILFVGIFGKFIAIRHAKVRSGALRHEPHP